jgi:hypothetical protein
MNGKRGPEPVDKTGEVVKTLRTYERPFMGTAEFAEELGYDTNPGVTKHLKRAVEAGLVEKTSISGYNVWYLPDLVSEPHVQAVDPDPGPGAKGGQPSNDYVRESTPTDTKDGEREKEADETQVPDGGDTLFERVSRDLGGTAFVVGVGAAVLNYIAVMVVMFTISSISLMASTTALDRKIGRYVESLRADMYEIGGLIGFIRTAREQGRLYPEEPTTPVERAARLDVWAFGMMFAAIGVMALLGITVEMWGAEAVVNTLTPLGTLGILLAITVIMGFAAVFLWASVLAAIAIDSARRWMRDDAPTTGGFE